MGEGHFIKRSFARLRAMAAGELTSLVVLLLIALSAWAFAALLDEVGKGESHRLDEAVLLAMRSTEDRGDPWGPPWLEELGRDFTALGGIGVLVVITALTVGFLTLHRAWSAAALMIAAVVGGLGLSLLLKIGIDRPRPDLVPYGSYVYTASFPSGHSMLAAVTYLTLGALLARVLPRRRLKSFVLSAAVLLTLLVGLSRVYLGVHWPTDVLAGWAAGAAWALLCWLIARWLQRHGAVEASQQQA